MESPGPDRGGADAAIEACPFCSSVQADVYEIDLGVWAVYCPRCRASGPHTFSSQEAVSLWALRQRG